MKKKEWYLEVQVEYDIVDYQEYRALVKELLGFRTPINFIGYRRLRNIAVDEKNASISFVAKLQLTLMLVSPDSAALRLFIDNNLPRGTELISRHITFVRTRSVSSDDAFVFASLIQFNSEIRADILSDSLAIDQEYRAAQKYLDSKTIVEE